MKPNTVILGWPNSWRKREDDSTKVFADTIRNAGAGKMALLVPKGIQRFPDTGDTVKVSDNERYQLRTLKMITSHLSWKYVSVVGWML